MSDETWLPIEGVDPASAEFPADARLGNERIVIFKTPSGYRGTEPHCPHQKGNLKTGVLMGGGTMIRCAWHNFIFKLDDTGAGVNCTGMVLKTYPIRENDGVLEGQLRD